MLNYESYSRVYEQNVYCQRVISTRYIIGAFSLDGQGVLFRWTEFCGLYEQYHTNVIFCSSKVLMCPGILLTWYLATFFINTQCPNHKKEDHSFRLTHFSYFDFILGLTITEKNILETLESCGQVKSIFWQIPFLNVFMIISGLLVSISLPIRSGKFKTIATPSLVFWHHSVRFFRHVPKTLIPKFEQTW